jgi:DNA-binding FadR family transcriptional regulator
MQNTVEPIKIKSLKEACVNRLEELILSGELKIGEHLPSERDFAARIGVSRPVLHDALVDLEAKGLVQILPRRGVFVIDYRSSGSTALLSSLLTYHNGNLDPTFTQSMIDMRLMFETETARLAALNRTLEQLAEFHTLLIAEEKAAGEDPQTLTDLDFSFHLSVAVASGNLVYPMIINSFKGVYTSLTGAFFRKYFGTPVAKTVLQYHVQIVGALEQKDAEGAVCIMNAMLKHGETYLRSAASLQV